MRITRLHLQDFGRHADLTIEPVDGLTVIRGLNESGKSTIQQAIEFGLYRKADSGAQAVMEAQRWGTSEPPVVEIDFQADGAPGRLVKRFAGNRGTAELTLGADVVRDPTLIQARIEQLTGIPNERFFRSTANVRHDELADLGEDDRQLHDRLQVVVSGADRGTTRAKRMLDDTIKRHRSEGPRNPGPLTVGRDRVTQLREELAVGEAALLRLESDRAAWVDAHERRRVLEAQLARHESELEEAERAVALAAKRDGAQARYEELRRAADLDAQLQALRAAPPAGLPLSELRIRVAGIEAVQFEISELEAELEVEGAEPEPVPSERKAHPWLFLALGALLVGLGPVAYLIVRGLAGVALLFVLAAAGVACIWRSVRQAQVARQQSLGAHLAQLAASQRSEGIAERQEAFRRRRRDLETRLAAIGVDAPEAASELLVRAEAHADDLLRIESELRGQLGDRPLPPDLSTQRDRAANEAEQARHALSAMGGVAADPAAARRRAAAQVTATRSARDEARSAEDRALGRVDTNEVDAERVAQLAEQLETSQLQLVDMERRMRVYQATLDAIVAAERATMMTAARFLEARMAPDIERITAGRYTQIAVDEQNLAFRVQSVEREDLVSVDSLSRGTVDQLYLTARLGLVRLVTMDRRPPIILDDPFVTFDAERTARALALLRELAVEQGFQVIYLTCSDAFDSLADRVIELDAPNTAPLAPSDAPPAETVEAGH